MITTLITTLLLAAVPCANGSVSVESAQIGKVFKKPGGKLLETIYVADPVAQRIVKIGDLAGSGWTTMTGASLGLSSFPVSSVATDKQGRIYFIVGTTLHRTDSMTGQNHVQMALPFSGVSNVHVCVRSNGWVYVADSSQVIAFDKVSPSALQKWTYSGWMTNTPTDMFVDGNGTVTVSGHDVLVGWSNSSNVGTILEIKATGTTATYHSGGSYYAPTFTGVAKDTKGRIYFTYASGVGRIDDITGTGYVLAPTTQAAGACWVSSSKVYTTFPTSGKLAAVSTFPGGAFAQYGAIGGGVGQFQNPADITIHTMDPRAL